MAEFALLSMEVFILLTLTGKLFLQQWARARCKRQVFEITYRSTLNPPETLFDSSVQVIRENGIVRGVGRCGPQKEQVELPLLEMAHWGGAFSDSSD